MKITEMPDSKNVRLKEWLIKEDKEDTYFILEDAKGRLLQYPKANFENEKNERGAYREGDKLHIPERP
jgi:hypothetical protein